MNLFKTTSLLFITASMVASSLHAQPNFSPPGKGEQPNIILIMADDQGWGDTGYNGHPFVQTPVMDEMAHNGFTFNRHYAASPVCSPTRASVLTGRNAIRSKVTNHGRYIRGHREQTLPRLLQSAGYVTGMFGKWHLSSGQPESPVNPGGLGFDEWLIGVNFFDNSPYLSRNGIVEHREGEVGSVLIVDETIDFIKKHKDGEKPIFAVTWFPSPHDPHLEVSSDPELYKDQDEELYGYYQEITLMDEQIGRLRNWLTQEGLDNTLIWYCSDNGGLVHESSGGRAKKGETYEGGLRVPGIIEWPARQLKGSSDVPVVTSDMLPTLAALTGAELNPNMPLDGIDITPIIEGTADSRPPIGFWHHFQTGQATWNDRILKQVMQHQQSGASGPAIPERLKKDIDEYPQFDDAALTEGKVALLDWPWKLHQRTEGGTKKGKKKKKKQQPTEPAPPKRTYYELYNLDDDPMEANDLSQHPEYAEKLAAMKKQLIAWQRSAIESLNGNDYPVK